jgi:hypothetical protein
MVEVKWYRAAGQKVRNISDGTLGRVMTGSSLEDRPDLFACAVEGGPVYLMSVNEWEPVDPPLIKPQSKWIGLQPIGATVRIVLNGLTIWKEAESFIGVDVKVVARFEISDVAMVVVQHPDGACCCFRAEMVRTPEQWAAEEREAVLVAMIAVCSDGISSISAHDAACLYDAGYRKIAE